MGNCQRRVVLVHVQTASRRGITREVVRWQGKEEMLVGIRLGGIKVLGVHLVQPKAPNQVVVKPTRPPKAPNQGPPKEPNQGPPNQVLSREQRPQQTNTSAQPSIILNLLLFYYDYLCLMFKTFIRI